MATTYLYVLPILVFVWFPLTFLVTFGIAAGLGHINLVFPYVSDTGSISPESCIFGQMVNFGCFLVLYVMYIRYRYVRELYRLNELSSYIQKLNRISIILGIVATIGISIAANFQETNILVVHLLGAFIGFGIGTIYLDIQTFLSFKIYSFTGTKCILYSRTILSAFSTITLLISGIFAIIAAPLFKGGITDCIVLRTRKLEDKNCDSILKWSKEDGGYSYHLVSTITEWLCVISITSYFLTYTSEFRKIHLYEPEINIDEPLINDA